MAAILSRGRWDKKRRVCWHMFICMYLSISTPNKYVLLIAINCHIAPIFCGLKSKISSWHLSDMKLQSIYIEHDHGLQIYKSHYNEYSVVSFLSKTLPLLHWIYLWKHWNIFLDIYVIFSQLCCAGSRFFFYNFRTLFHLMVKIVLYSR